ncbi:hypothetical protein BKH41_08770 [Helicobacter sp. 12S02232-10]|uniref:outer membrane protein assembly factor BamE domain-containing protein n=1 Tax=Helicobacter sp. 12S02232-10 TaxID=1476197 RepID=UPI000BA535DA|nr:outer membrane protein assembly factor BamE [Helicobacter sp. 12S02232-10]PAF46587.1 hypothetical protein BKH41_08770 [Helicobacter sp. 12S02232-10]
MRTLTYLLMAGILFAGCAVTESGNMVLKEKTKEEVQKTIVKGKTTKDQIFKIYGEPTLKDLLSNGGEKWFYQYVTTSDNPENHIPIFNLFNNSIDGEEKDLVILFNNKGIVQNYDVSFKKIEAKGGVQGMTYEKK